MNTPNNCSTRKPSAQITTASTPEEAKLKATACHEAGHVVVCVYHGLPVTKASIVPDGDALGSCWHPSPMMVECASARERKTVACQYIIASLAGLPAQRLVDPGCENFHGEDDYTNAFKLSVEYEVFPHFMHHVGDEEHHRYLRKTLGREARRLVRKQRRAVRALAEVLLKRKTIEGHETVDEIVRPHLA